MTVAKTRDIQRLLKTLICFGIQQYISNPYFVPNSYEFSLLEIEPFFFPPPHTVVSLMIHAVTVDSIKKYDL